jgi:two-component system cell cycle response regulator CpdR
MIEYVGVSSSPGIGPLYTREESAAGRFSGITLCLVPVQALCVKAGHSPTRGEIFRAAARIAATTNQGKPAMIRILLAEDDQSMRTYLSRALENAGYEVDAVDCGTAAQPLLEDDGYDQLLTEIVMPEMDGIELAQRCAELSPHTKVMFITGFAAVALRPNRELPQTKILSKPFHLKDLVLEVEQLFEDRATASL